MQVDYSLHEAYDFEQFLKAVADPNRLRVLQLVMQKELCVCKIYEELNLPQNLVSHHLKVLKELDLVKCRKDKNWKYYSANRQLVRSYLQLVRNSLLKKGWKQTDDAC